MHLFGGNLSFPNLQKRAYNGTNHVSEKPVGLDDEYVLIRGVFYPFGTSNGAIVRFYIGMQFAKTGKIGVVEKNGQSLFNSLYI